MCMSEIIDKVLSKERETLTYQKKWKELYWIDWRPQETPANDEHSVQLPSQCVRVSAFPAHNGFAWKWQLKCKWGDSPRVYGPLTSLSLKDVLSAASVPVANALLSFKSCDTVLSNSSPTNWLSASQTQKPMWVLMSKAQILSRAFNEG